MAESTNAAVLRGITHANIFLGAGLGVESIVHAMAHARLPKVSNRFKAILAELNAGKTAEEAIGKALKKAQGSKKNHAYTLLFGALLTEGAQAEERLLEASRELLSTNESDATRKAERTKFFSKMGTIFSVLVFSIPLLHFLNERIPPQYRIGEAIPPEVRFSAVGVLILIAAILMTSKD